MASIGVHPVDAMMLMAGRGREVYCVASNRGGQSLYELARCIRDLEPYPISSDDVLHGVAALEAAIQSATIRQPVQVSD